MQLATTQEYGVHFQTGVPVEVHFVRNTAAAPKKPPPGDPYQQRIEPAGRYMLHNPEARELPAGWAKGVARFASPLVLWFNTQPDRLYDDQSWKRQLERRYRKRGKALSRALLADGYDAVVTVMPGAGDTREIVDLTPLKGTR